MGSLLVGISEVFDDNVCLPALKIICANLWLKIIRVIRILRG